MSKTGAIIIETSFLSKNTFGDVLIELLSNGWTINQENGISFMVDGSYDWENTENKNSDEVFRRINNSIDNNQETCIDIAWCETNYKLGMTYLSSERLMYKLHDEQKKMADLDIVDFSWYIDKLKPVFDLITFFRMQLLYD